MKTSTRALIERAFRGRASVVGPLGVGGMAEIWLLLDTHLARPMALKVPLDDFAEGEHRARFLSEARIAAHLEHANIPPVYEQSVLQDNRPYFTMRHVSGRLIDQDWIGAPEDDQALEARVNDLIGVAAALAHAHGRRIVHRDLKPANLRRDDAGVQVLDWGIAVEAGAPPAAALMVAGTAPWSAPEQLRGEVDAQAPTADVFSLGALLYFALTGEVPFEGWIGEGFDDAVRAGPPTLPASVPAGLAALCGDALRADPRMRPPDAAAFYERLREWQVDLHRRQEALAVIAEVDRAWPQITGLREREQKLKSEGETRLRLLSVYAPYSEKAPAWSSIARADALAGRCELLADSLRSKLNQALQLAPDLADASDRLADADRADHETLITSGRTALAEVALQRLRRHAASPSALAKHGPYLAGMGWVTLATDPPGAQILVERYEEIERRQIPVPYTGDRIGPAPLDRVALPEDSYRWTLSLPERHDTVLPMHILRGRPWNSCPPGSEAPAPVWLPPADAIRPDERYVPAGWCRCGDSIATYAFAPLDVWVPAFAMRVFPVTNAEFLAFLNDLLSRGQEEDALRWAPHTRHGNLTYVRLGDGRFAVGVDADGDRWELDRPVVHISWRAASAFAAWEAERTGLPWRLPRELEWEKAARGVDGRAFPWGDWAEPTFANCSYARQRPELAAVDSFPTDVSPYGIRGMAGNAMEMTLDFTTRIPPVDADGRMSPAPIPGERPLRTARGGAWSREINQCHAAARRGWLEDDHDGVLGFRLVRFLSIRSC